VGGKRAGFFRFLTRSKTSQASTRPSSSENEGWRGIHFVVVSAIITVGLIGAVYASKLILPDVHRSTVAQLQKLQAWVSSWNGIRLSSIDLEVVRESETSAAAVAPFEAAAGKSRKTLEKYLGQPFWLLNLSDIRDRLLDEGWAKVVYVRRAFPNSLKIQIVPRTPAFLVRGAQHWVVTDEQGSAILVVKQIPGTWTHLPSVFGLEETFAFGQNPRDLNRQLAGERELFEDLNRLMSDVKNRLQLDPVSIRLERDAGPATWLYHVNFSSFVTILRMQDWEHRLPHLQFVLSDLKMKDVTFTRVMGQFEGRWFVDAAPQKKVTKI